LIVQKLAYLLSLLIKVLSVASSGEIYSQIGLSKYSHLLYHISELSSTVIINQLLHFGINTEKAE
jgi:hypothetical protein